MLLQTFAKQMQQLNSNFANRGDFTSECGSGSTLDKCPRVYNRGMETETKTAVDNNPSSSPKLLTNIWLVVVLLAAIGFGTWYWQQRNINKLNGQISELNEGLDKLQTSSQLDLAQASYTYTSQKGVTLEIYRPAKDSKVTSPVVVVGQVPGNWSFEATFSVKLKSADGNVVAQAPAQLHGDWMTKELVPFTAKLEFGNAKSGQGSLILQKNNPSGLPENDDTITIPVQL